METPPKLSFHTPHEHGAWWTFFSCLIAGSVEALAWKADAVAVLCLALGMAAFFLASDWITALAQAALEGKGRRASAPGAWEGWALATGGSMLLIFALLRAEARHAGLGADLGKGLAFWGFAIAVVLLLRLKLKPRSLALMMPSAMILTAPVMLLGTLAFGALDAMATGFWGLWAWFYAFGVLYVQTWLRGAMLPKWRLILASLPYFAQAFVLELYARWQGALVLTLLSLRILWRLRGRLMDYKELEAELEGKEMPALLPTDPVEIRKLGWEQVGWSLALSAIWIWRYWP